jgi:hypothetical protein
LIRKKLSAPTETIDFDLAWQLLNIYVYVYEQERMKNKQNKKKEADWC